MTKFTYGSQSLSAGIPSNADVTVKNIGGADAGSFQLLVVFNNTDTGSQGSFDPIFVDDGLVATGTLRLPAPIGVNDPGHYTFTVAVDWQHEVDESNEDDNLSTLQIEAVALPNLNVGAGGFAISETADGTLFVFVVTNSGAGDASEIWSYRYSWTTPVGDSGVFGEFEEDSFIDAGANLSVKDTIDSIGPGDYTVTLRLDSKDELAESDETDNEISFHFVPD